MSSLRVGMDPEQILAFAELLSQFGQRVSNYDATLLQELNRLGNTWKDHDYQKLREAFFSSRQLLKGFIEQINQTVPELKRDAQTVIEAENQMRCGAP